MTDNNLESIVSPAQFITDPGKPVLSVLDNLCCYQVSGEDASTFLQGQFSNDINEVSENKAQITSYSTAKGRMLAIFYVCKQSDHYLLITSADIAEDVMKRLQMYVMRSKVTISKLEDHTLIGLSNDIDASVLNHLSLTQPGSDYQTSMAGDTLCVKVPGVNLRYMLIGGQTLLEQCQQLSKNEVEIYANEYWQWLDILAGLPMITAATQEAFVPQMANMELINGVSFSKGCYPGQEVVARLHYLGNANRRMFRVKTDANQALNAGDEIYSSASDQAIGKFVTTVNIGDNKIDALAILRVETSKSKSLSTSKENNNSVEIMELPYAVPTEPKEKKS